MKNSMLSNLLASIGIKPEAAPVEATAEASDALATLQASFDAFKAEAEAQTQELTTALATALTAVKQADEKVAELQALVDAAAAEKVAAEAAAVAAKAAARKEKIVEAVGTERAESLLAGLEGLEDAAFDAVISAMNLATEKEAKSTMFTETGITAEADAAKVTQVESEEMRILKSRHQA